MIAVVLRAAWGVPAKRKEWLEGTGQAHQNDLTALEVQLKELELQAKQDEAALRTEIIERLRAAFPESEVTDGEATQTIDDFVLPPLRSLGRSGVVSLEAQGEPDDLDPPGGSDPDPKEP